MVTERFTSVEDALRYESLVCDLRRAAAEIDAVEEHWRPRITCR